jgi:integrase
MRHHKASGRAYVFHKGRRHYLGPWNTAEARRAYREWVNRWESSERPTAISVSKAAAGGTVGDLVDAFMLHAARHYVHIDGQQTDEVGHFKVALAPLLAAHLHRDVDAVLPRDLIAIVEAWKAAKQSRGYINKNLGRIKRVFKWGLSPAELVSAETFARLSLVRGVPLGQAEEPDEVLPVELRVLARTLRRLEADGRHAFAAMVRLQYYCGARPGEVCRLRTEEIHRRSFRVGGRVIPVPEGVAVFTPKQHKLRKKNHLVYYTLGPRAQAALAPFLDTADAEGFVFHRGAIGRRRLSRFSHCDPEHYSKTVGEAAEAAHGGDRAARWSPGQLRHNFLTRWDALGSIELGSAAVRHKSIATTAIYVQRDLSRVGSAALQLG